MSNENIAEKLSNICLCCYNEDDNLRCIYKSYQRKGKTENYSEMLSECFRIEIKTEASNTEDTMKICEECIIKLRESLSFRKQIEISQSKLEDMMKHLSCNKNEGTSENTISVSDKWMWTDKIKHDDTEESDELQSEECFASETQNFKKKVEKDVSDNNTSNHILKKAIQRTLKNLKLLKSSSLIEKDLEIINKKESKESIKLDSEESLEYKKKRKRETCNKWKKIREPYNLDPKATNCYLCTDTFTTHARLISHMASHFPNWICSVCGKIFATKFQMKGHMKRTHVNCDTVCPVCSMVVKRGSLKRHIDTHKGLVTPNKCKYCDARFASYRKREVHMSQVHGMTLREHPCKLCNKAYATAGTLGQHVKKHHLNEKPHVCPECSKPFFSQSGLKSHMVTHTKEKNYTCSICFKTYAAKSGLRTHIKKYH